MYICLSSTEQLENDSVSLLVSSYYVSLQLFSVYVVYLSHRLAAESHRITLRVVGSVQYICLWSGSADKVCCSL